ncbi:hypothetical protein SLS62_001492 [Diatrype stigma]|uniref:Regulator of G protein signaling superfamily n=1 Tax=Diatrype stigma TaxID=117547 RepID=A0AAN9V223_9PEZI
MNYLVYVEHSAENLQFFLWYQDYSKRFHEADTPDLALAPEWTPEMQTRTMAMIQKDAADKRRRESPATVAIFKGTDFEKNGGATSAGAAAGVATLTTVIRADSVDPFSTPPSTPGDGDDLSFLSGSQATTHRPQANDAFDAVGFKQPFTIQPFRAELARIIATYLATGAPRQLNLSDRERRAALAALSRTTHPSALRAAARAAEDALRRQAHPNFVRWSICNANPARVAFARGLGGFLVAAGTAAAVVLTLGGGDDGRKGAGTGGVARGYRAIGAVGWVLGIATLVAAWKGMCVVLHGMHHRHVRPWELFQDGVGGGENSSSSSNEDDGSKKYGSSSSSSSSSFDSFGPSNRGYEDEPWVVRYARRNVVRRVFDRQVWIQEPALRQIQDTIFVQALLAALLASGALTTVFVCLPGGNLF